MLLVPNPVGGEALEVGLAEIEDRPNGLFPGFIILNNIISEH